VTIKKNPGIRSVTTQKLASSVQSLQSSAIRELLKHSKMPGVISLGGGIPNPDLFDHEGLQIAADAVLSRHFGEAFQYGLSEGYPALREAIAQICADRSISCQADEVVITSGSQQSLDILARALINPGDTVVVERPTYLAALQVFSLAQASLESVGTDGEGMNVDELEDLAASKPIKAVYIVPTFGNPGGVTLSENRRKKLVELSKRYDFVIIEDDPYSEINYTTDVFRPLMAHAKDIGNEQNIVYTSTFSKILSPGTRVGWLVVPEWLKRAVVNLKQTTDLHTSMLSQLMTYEYLQTGRLAGQIALIRDAYRQKYQTFASELEKELGDVLTFHKPKGGMFLWAKMNNGINTTQWLEKTLSNGVVFVPGEFFYCSDPDRSTLRMSFVTATDEQLKEAVKRLKISL
jgi:2-aminoadipate transaminase